MPARQPVPGVVQITFKFTYGADIDVINRFYQKYSGTPGALSDTGAAAWAAAGTSAWSAHQASALSDKLALNFVLVEDLTSDTGAVGDDTTGAVGGDTTTETPAGVCVVVAAHIERRYRGGHPRQYLAGLPANNLLTPQEIQPGFVTSLQSGYVAFRAAVAAGCPTAIAPATDVNVSYFQGFTNHTYPSGRVRPIPNPRATPVVDQIAFFEVRNKLGSQRRRNLQSA
jgi:hypothetical protein